MLKKLSAIGNSLGVVIEKPILDLLKIDRDTLLEVTTDGRGIYLCPTTEEHAARVQAATARVMRNHDAALKKLAE